MSNSESDSDTDSVEEIQVKKYLGTFKEQLKQAKAQTCIRTGIKRQPGHYHLRDTRQAVLVPQRPAYGGTHWDIDIPQHLQRSTPRLTRYAIRKAILKEQERRVEFGDQNRGLQALSKLENLNKEFDNVLVYNYGRMGLEEDKKKSLVYQNKDFVHWELMRKTFGKQQNEEMEKERQHRIKVLRGIYDKKHRTPSIENLVDGMTDTNFKRSLVNKNIEEAQINLENKQNEVVNEYKLAMSEMLDESLAKVVHTFAANDTRRAFENEKRRRMSEHPINANPTREQKIMKVALNNLVSVYKDVEAKENEEETKYKNKVIEQKAMMQEQLIRKVTTNIANKLVAEERARQIKEAEENIDEPSKNAMRHLVTRVQRQMLLQKFKGKWVNLVKKPKDVEDAERVNETEHDKKLRLQRETQRRSLCVIRGDGDE
ncbi:uncharacterized protein LOC127705872 [Mytilus californianus]|uniref:uncharacterized protein LOC127705872 n=1 Tax=Mytilus californianus TaxID=6549 RepID=UPI002246BF69|nr:uncharacterized protein LOC127705872 [Mytilus californianus]